MALAARGSMLALVVRSVLADVRLREGVQELLEILPVSSGMVSTLPHPGLKFSGKNSFVEFAMFEFVFPNPAFQKTRGLLRGKVEITTQKHEQIAADMLLLR